MKEKMEQTIQALKQIEDWITKFETYSDKNNLSKDFVSKLQPNNIQILNKYLLKLAQRKSQKHVISWVSTEYQALEIFLTSISVIAEKTIEDFTPVEWSEVYKIFPYKLPLTVKYESLRIVLGKKQPRRRWTTSQQNFLMEIVRQQFNKLRGFTKKNKWNDVARQLFIRSDGQFFRQGKHCRERWLNHLHPSISNNNWAFSEDIKLLFFVLKRGKKWAWISKKLAMKRSECMVKKRFYELIKIDEQSSLSIQTLKNLTKLALQQLKEQENEKKNEKKESFISKSNVGQYQRKRSTPNKDFQIGIQENRVSFQVKSEAPRGENEEEKAKSSRMISVGQTQRQYGSQSCLNGFINNGVWNQNNFGYWMNHFNLMGSMLNPFYVNYSPLIMPIQNNIINQSFKQQNHFYKF